MKRAFTLIEIVVVIAIILALLTILGTNVVSAKYKSNYSRTVADLETIATSISLFKTEYGHYPKDGNGGVTDSDKGAPGVGLNMTMPANAGAYEDRDNFRAILAWPTPPCKKWFYDWENWDDNAVDQVAHTYRISIRKPGTVSSLYYRCISSSDSKCVGDGSSYFTGPTKIYPYGGGEDVETLSEKAITCWE